jgi:hypothetical protein
VSGLSPAYPYDWNLPLRVRDPRKTLLTRTLSGPDAPTWVVRWKRPTNPNLAAYGRVQYALTTHYRKVVGMCMHSVWLHKGVHRTIVPRVRCR